jgi:hypothetical protein
MKKNILILACTVSSFTHSMETNNFSIKIYGTIINVTNGPLHVLHNNTCVVGQHQQQLLEFSNIEKSYIPGELSCSHTLKYIENIYSENSSDDDTYKTFEVENRHKLSKNAQTLTTKNKVIRVTEPCISSAGWRRDPQTDRLIPTTSYTIHRFDENHQKTYLDFKDDKAVREASKDLILCYEKALIHGVPHPEKNIAFSTLSADVGFPRDKAAPIAIKTIITFLKNNPHTYNCITLCVQKRSEFTAYKKLLNDYWQRICLLYCVYKNYDTDVALSWLPLDVINHIAWLTINK